MSATSPAARYRAAAAALRGIRARSGQTAATTSAVDRHEAIKATAVADLMDGGHRHLVGLLVAEEGLAERMRIARLLGQARPELADRLLTTRRQLKETS
jgi:hypothetical protein